MIKLTVIIPFLNEREEVYHTLRSIRMSVGKRVNIILINDASEKNYNYVELSKKFDAIYIQNNRRKGSTYCRDKGIEKCNTPYFLFLDAHMRFYSQDWDIRIIKELEKEERVLLCCNTKILQKENEKIKEIFSEASGATVYFERNEKILDTQWRLKRNFTLDNIEDIPCVLGAAYAGSKRYWQYLLGMQGLEEYGMEEQYISLKVWLEGGRCRLLNDVYVGHIYRSQAPYQKDNIAFIYNKLIISDLLLPWDLNANVIGMLYQKNPLDFVKAYHKFLCKKKLRKKLKIHYQNIFERKFDDILPFFKNGNEKHRNDEKIDLKRLFQEVLLNCNSIPSLGLWNGRMGCILFLVQYAYFKKNKVEEELVEKLIDDLYENVNKNLSINFADGICGIAYGLAWIINNEYIKGDIDEVLVEADNYIMERNPLYISDYSWATGLSGIIYYVIYRCQIADKQNRAYPFCKNYLKQLKRAASLIIRDPIKVEAYEMSQYFLAFCKKVHIKIPSLLNVLETTKIREEELLNKQIWGLQEGKAGRGVHELNKNNI